MRNRVLAGPAGGAYLATSHFAGLWGVAGIMIHSDVFMWLAITATLISWFLGWLIDQARWWCPVMLAPRDDLCGVDGMSPRRVRVAAGFAGVMRIIGAACCLAWTYRWLEAATIGGPW